MTWEAGRRNRRLDYHKKNFENPYFSRASENPAKQFRFRLPKVSPKSALSLISLLGAGYGLFWFVAESQFFAIKNIDVFVPEKFNADEIRNIAWQKTQEKRFSLSQSNLLFYDSHKVYDDIASRYTTSNLSVKKIYPDRVTISFDEKIYEAVWMEQGKYYLLNKDDESAVPTDLEQLKDKKFPLIKYDGSELYNAGKIASTSQKVRFIVDIYANISKNNPFKVDFFSFNDLEAGPIELKVKDGPRVIFSERENLDKQLKKLYTIISERLKNDFMKKTYVDVRFGDAVYVK